MKKYITLVILALLVVSTFSASSNVLKTKNIVIKEEIEPINDAFITFMEEGIKELDNYGEGGGFIRDTYMVEMRDGIHLATDVYLPLVFDKPHGCIFLRTPYDKDDLYDLGIAIALIGWPIVIQDIRGMHASEGIYEGYRKCQVDGPDSLEWIASRDWSNGKVATVGPSALGITQLFFGTLFKSGHYLVFVLRGLFIVNN